MGKIINVLIADVSMLARYVIRTVLSKVGCCVQDAGDGQKALDLDKQNISDLVMTDISMPKTTGIELVATLQKLNAYKFNPILVLAMQRGKIRSEQANYNGSLPGL